MTTPKTYTREQCYEGVAEVVAEHMGFGKQYIIDHDNEPLGNLGLLSDGMWHVWNKVGKKFDITIAPHIIDAEKETGGDVDLNTADIVEVVQAILTTQDRLEIRNARTRLPRTRTPRFDRHGR
jgi:hypothetical protein